MSASPVPLVTLVRAKATAIISFNNPPRGYLNRAQVGELSSILDDIEQDDSVRSIVFTGAVPGVFIRHYDVNEILDAVAAVKASGHDRAGLMEAGKRGNPISALFDRVDAFPKPTIAAINGFCQGGGFEFALCCDIRIAEAGDYQIGLPETNIGIFPGAGGTQRLPRAIGEAQALELILRGRTLSPDEAASKGLVHFHVTSPALEYALQIADELNAKSPQALAAAKVLVKGANQRPLVEGCATERGVFSSLLAESDDAISMMSAFLENGEDINNLP
ncbi:MAG: enoyl-CoA hydratase/isomerase family protein [Parvibaculum sp.]